MNRVVEVGVLGHWGGNIGHDIMALGVQTLFRCVFGDRLRTVRIEQHRPFDIYPRWNPLRHLGPFHHDRNGRLVRTLKRFLNRRDVSNCLWRGSWVGKLDLGVACGGPLITPHMAHGDLELMFHHVYGAFASFGVPVLNLSVGSCYPWERQPDAILENENVAFLKRIFEYCTVTTVRDEVAQRLCAGLGKECELIPDTGFIAGKALSEMAARPPEPRYLVISYQKYGANEDWGQNVDAVAWWKTVRELLSRLKRRYQVVFVCHNEAEIRLAEQMDASTPHHRPRTLAEYATFASGAMAGICSRLHAAMSLAATGSPVVGVGTDTRLGTLRATGLPCFYVKQVTADVLEETIEELIARRAAERERLIALREKAMNRYVEIVKATVQG